MTATPGATTPTTSSAPLPQPLPVRVCLLVGVVAAVVGLLPWLATGGRLLIQNLWATDATPETMPRALLPFSQYTITLIIGVIVVGSAVGGLWARAVRIRLPRLGATAVGAGVLVVQVAALVQTARAVRSGLREGRESFVYLAALEAVAVLSLLVGTVALALVARAPRGGAVLGLAVGALALGPWLFALFVLVGGGITTLPVADALATGVPAALVGATIGWAGLRTVGRVLGAACALVLVVVVPALTTAITNAAGSRVLAHDQREMAAYAVEVFSAALTTPALVLRPLVVAVVVAVGVAVGLRRRRRREE